MLKEIPKATTNHKMDLENHSKMNFLKTKYETVSELGFNRNQVSQFQRMADHEEQVQEAIAKTRRNEKAKTEAVLDAEAKIGELTAQIPKAQGKRTDIKPIRNSAEKSKSEQLATIGIKQDTAERFERLAKHPEAEARTKKGVQGGTPCPGTTDAVRQLVLGIT